MIDSGITSKRRIHIWLCNNSLRGDTPLLQNGGHPSDVAQYILALAKCTLKIVLLMCAYEYMLYAPA